MGTMANTKKKPNFLWKSASVTAKQTWKKTLFFYFCMFELTDMWSTSITVTHRGERACHASLHKSTGQCSPRFPAMVDCVTTGIRAYNLQMKRQCRSALWLLRKFLIMLMITRNILTHHLFCCLSIISNIFSTPKNDWSKPNMIGIWHPNCSC